MMSRLMRSSVIAAALLLGAGLTGPVRAQLLGAGLTGPVQAHSAPETFRIIDIPNGTHVFADDINNRGVVVGYFSDPNFVEFGFLKSERFIGVIEAPNAALTVAEGINDHNEITGTTVAIGSSLSQGFVLSNGQFTVFSASPGAGITPTGINNRGDIVGFVNVDGFLRSNGTFTTIRVPRSIATRANGINDRGHIVGEFTSAALQVHGFLLSRGRFLTFDVPNASDTKPRDINNFDEVVGVFTGASGEQGFLWHKGKFTTISIPESVTTNVLGINDLGQIVGIFVDSAGTVRAFEAHVRAFLEHP